MKVFSINDLASLAKTRRKQLGLTQAQLASKVGVKPLWVSQFESGKATVQMRLVLRTLKVLNLPLTVELPASSNTDASSINSNSTPNDMMKTPIREVIDLDSILNPNLPTNE